MFRQPSQRALLSVGSRLSLSGFFVILTPPKALIERASFLEDSRECKVTLLSLFSFFIVFFRFLMFVRDTGKHTVPNTDLDMWGILENVKLIRDHG